MPKVSELVSQNVTDLITNYYTWGGIITNVKSYGAKGDGSTDDTSAIQQAINHAISIGTHEVTFPPGSYHYGVLTNIVGLTFVGDGVTLTGTTPLTLTSYTTLKAQIAAAGTVSSITSPNTDIAIGGTSTVPTVTLNSGTGANQIVKRDGSGHINADTVTTNANLTGDVTSVGNTTTLTNAPVIAKVLTGYTSGAGTVTASDSILQAIQKLNGNDATNANLTGMVTSVGNATTVVTNANLTGDVTSTGNATTIKTNVALAGSPTTTTQTAGDNSTKISTTAYADAIGALKVNTSQLSQTATANSVVQRDSGANILSTGSMVNVSSLTYGGGTSQTHIKNVEGNNTLTLQHAESSSLSAPMDTMRIYRDISSLGGTTLQTGGAIVHSTVQASCTHNEFGFFSVLNNNSTTASAQNVSIYGQATSLGTAASQLWAGVFEVRNTTSTGGGTSVDHTLTGIEVDVSNAKAFSDTNKKTGVECIAYGGGENTEAFSIYAANNTRGNGTYATGHWRYGFRILPNALHATLGVGFDLGSGCGTGIQMTSPMSNYALQLQDSTNSSGTAINIGAGYSRPMAVPPDRKIQLNTEANSQGISYVSANTAVTLDGAAIGVANHTTFSAATAGGTQAVPASVSGYIGVYVNGFLKKVPYFNV